MKCFIVRSDSDKYSYLSNKIYKVFLDKEMANKYSFELEKENFIKYPKDYTFKRSIELVAPEWFDEFCIKEKTIQPFSLFINNALTMYGERLTKEQKEQIFDLNYKNLLIRNFYVEQSEIISIFD